MTNTFTAPAGLWVYYDSQDRNNAGSLVAELRDPTGAVVFSYNAAFDTQSLQGIRAPTVRHLPDDHQGQQPGCHRFLPIPTSGFELGYSCFGARFNPQRHVRSRLSHRHLSICRPGGPTSALRWTPERLRFRDCLIVAARRSDPHCQRQYGRGRRSFRFPVTGTYRLLIENQTGAAATYAARILDIAAQPSFRLKPWFR